jgi:hypothetical protein
VNFECTAAAASSNTGYPEVHGAGPKPALLQARSMALLQHFINRTMGKQQRLHRYGPYSSHRSLIHYFKRWTHGRFKEREIYHLDLNLAQQSGGLRSHRHSQRASKLNETFATQLLNRIRSEQCPELHTEADLHLVRSDAADKNGVQHAMFLDKGGGGGSSDM